MISAGTVVLALYVIVCLGPLRRPFWRNWRFTIAGSLAGWGAWFISGAVKGAADPWWMPLGVGLMVGLGAGAAFKEWFDQVLGGGS